MKKIKLVQKYLTFVPKSVVNYTKNNETGQITLEIERNKPFDKVVCWLFSKPKVGFIPLDVMSSKAWLLMDGKKTLEEISILLKQEDEKDDALGSMHMRVVKFFNYLNFNKWIKLQKP